MDLVREVVLAGDKNSQTSFAYGPSFPAGREWENVSGVLDGDSGVATDVDGIRIQ